LKVKPLKKNPVFEDSWRQEELRKYSLKSLFRGENARPARALSGAPAMLASERRS